MFYQKIGILSNHKNYKITVAYVFVPRKQLNENFANTLCICRYCSRVEIGSVCGRWDLL